MNSDEVTGLKRLWKYAGPHRPQVIAAIFHTTMGKVMDVVPEILIGAVLDVIVRGQGSFVATQFGIADRWQQLLVLATANLFAWIFESLFGYWSAISWRNLAQTIEHEMQAGMIGLNTFQVTLPETPFGGQKDSGYGSEGGIEGIDGYMQTKYVSEV